MRLIEMLPNHPKSPLAQVVAVAGLVVGIGLWVSSSNNSTAGNNASTPGVHGGVAAPGLTFKDLQNSSSSSYIVVSVPEYYQSGHNFYSESKLYRDRLELSADPRLHEPKQFELIWGSGNIDKQGNGPVYYFGRLDLCSELRPQKQIKLPDYREEYSAKICIDGERLVASESLYVEAIGEVAARFIKNRICKPGRYGGCIVSRNGDRPSTEVFLVIPIGRQ
jgi:hypothetical protein